MNLEVLYVDSLTVSNSANLPNYYKKSETYSKSDVYTKTETYSKSEVDNKLNVVTSTVGGGNLMVKQGNVCTIQFTSYYLGKNYSQNEHLSFISDANFRPRSMVRFLMIQLNSLKVREVVINTDGWISVGQTNILEEGYWVGTVTYFTD